MLHDISPQSVNTDLHTAHKDRIDADYFTFQGVAVQQCVDIYVDEVLPSFTTPGERKIGGTLTSVDSKPQLLGLLVQCSKPLTPNAGSFHTTIHLIYRVALFPQSLQRLIYHIQNRQNIIAPLLARLYHIFTSMTMVLSRITILPSKRKPVLIKRFNACPT